MHRKQHTPVKMRTDKARALRDVVTTRLPARQPAAVLAADKFLDEVAGGRITTPRASCAPLDD